MAVYRDLSGYLRSLPGSRRAAFDQLTAAVAAVEVPASNHSFVFRAEQTDHPVFDDAERVFWKAVEELHLREASNDGELPLLFWGFHSIDVLGRRHSNGVLITDQTISVVDVGRGSWRFPTSTVDPASIAISGEGMAVDAAHLDLAQIGDRLAPTGAVDAVAYLSAVVSRIRNALETGAVSAPSPESELETVEQIVLGSRLSADFLISSRPKDAKGLAKLASKWKLDHGETVLASLSSATFVGVYGIAITDAAVVSRDLSEAVERTPLEQVEGFAWDEAAKGFRVSPEHLAPTHPAVTDDNRAYVTALFDRLVRAARRTN